MSVTDVPTSVRGIEPSAVLRPQPLGIFDGPAGLLLVGAGEGSAELLAALAAGRVPTTWPAGATTLAAALDSPEDATAALATLGDTTVDAVNRLVLAPTTDHLAAARLAAGEDPVLGVVVAAAAYASGLSDVPPTADGLDGEAAVLALTVRAARALEFKDAPSALRALRAAVGHASEVGPALHGRVLGMLAERRSHTPAAMEEAVELYDEALRVLASTDLRELRATFELERGIVLHQLAEQQPYRLVEAIRSYQSALVVLHEERDPERFALANMNVGIAILALPMTQASDQVRLGVAVQSLRAALRVYRPDTHGWQWSSSQMNLANALQYLPSTHREENLQEAVELYEAVLSVRSPRSDPLGYARVLANQANALAHLAVFDHAVAKYDEARALFAAAGEPDAVAVVDRQLAEIEAQRGA
jgi:hypothetical protein